MIRTALTLCILAAVSAGCAGTAGRSCSSASGAAALASAFGGLSRNVVVTEYVDGDFLRDEGMPSGTVSGDDIWNLGFSYERHSNAIPEGAWSELEAFTKRSTVYGGGIAFGGIEAFDVFRLNGACTVEVADGVMVAGDLAWHTAEDGMTEDTFYTRLGGKYYLNDNIRVFGDWRYSNTKYEVFLWEDSTSWNFWRIGCDLFIPIETPIFLDLAYESIELNESDEDASMLQLGIKWYAHKKLKVNAGLRFYDDDMGGDVNYYALGLAYKAPYNFTFHFDWTLADFDTSANENGFRLMVETRF